MKNKLLKSLFLIAAGFLGVTSLGNVSNKKVETKAADNYWTKTVDLRYMFEDFAEARNADSTTDLIDVADAQFSYTFRHGSVGDGSLNKFTNVIYNSKSDFKYGVQNTDDCAILRNSSGIQMFSRNNDGLICAFTAKEDMFFTALNTSVQGWTTDMIISFFKKAKF